MTCPPRFSRTQKGYVLSIEFAALAIVTVLSAIVLMSVAADKLPEVTHQWFEAAVDNTEMAAHGYITNICTAYAIPEEYTAGDTNSSNFVDINSSQLQGLCNNTSQPVTSPQLWSKF